MSSKQRLLPITIISGCLGAVLLLVSVYAGSTGRDRDETTSSIQTNSTNQSASPAVTKPNLTPAQMKLSPEKPPQKKLFDEHTLAQANKWFLERDMGGFGVNSDNKLIPVPNLELEQLSEKSISELRTIVSQTGSVLAKLALFEKLGLLGDDPTLFSRDQNVEAEVEKLAIDLAAAGNTGVLSTLVSLYFHKSQSPNIKNINGKNVALYSLRSIEKASKYMTLLSIRGDVGLASQKEHFNSNLTSLRGMGIPNADIPKLVETGRIEGIALYDQLSKTRLEKGLPPFDNTVDPSAEKIIDYILFHVSSALQSATKGK